MVPLRILGLLLAATALPGRAYDFPVPQDKGPGTAPVAATDPDQISAARAVTLETVASGLQFPWGLAWLPDGTMLVTEQPGRLRLVRDGALLADPVAGVPDVLYERQGGLLDVAVHPRFAETGWVYLSYAHGTEAANRTRVARGRLVDGALQDVIVIFEVAKAKPNGQHFGSRLAFLPDETLLISVGDGGNRPVTLDGQDIRLQAQHPDSHLGAVSRVTDDGSVPPDNPFLDRPDAQPQLFSMGHRNIQGLVHDPVLDRIFATEHGPQGGDELNWVRGGENYGWPIVTHGANYGRAQEPITPYTSQAGYADPLIAWTPSIGASGLALFRVTAYPDWDGDLLAGGLRVAGRHPGALFHIDLDDGGAVIGQARIDVGDVRVRDVRVGPDGAIYLLVADPAGARDREDRSGRIVRIVPPAG